MSGSSQWWREAVFYQIYPRSFMDTNGDGIGDLAGITNKLDYVADLGVDAIWISPFFQSPMRDYGYDVSDYRAIDPMFGTMEDFEELLAAAHDRKLKVVIDQVYSHTAKEHDWFQQSRSDPEGAYGDYYVWANPREDGSAPNNWLARFGGPAWAWDPIRQQYYLHNFLDSMPDLNFHFERVQDEICDIARFWLDKGVDGFRLDVANFFFHDEKLRDNPAVSDPPARMPVMMQEVKYNANRPQTPDFLAKLRAVMDGYDGRMTVAEIAGPDAEQIMRDYTEPGKLHTAYSFGFLGRNFSAQFFRDQITPWFGVKGWPSWAFSNHDVARAISRWAPPQHAATVARMLAALLLSLRGTPFIYQGEELGLPQAHIPQARLRDPFGKAFYPYYKGRDGCRTPMPWSKSGDHCGFSEVEPWLPFDESHYALAVDEQEGDPSSQLEHVRALIDWRRERDSMRHGTMEFVGDEPSLLSFHRISDAEKTLCVFNLSVKSEHFAVPKEFERASLAPGSQRSDEKGSVRLGPFEYFVTTRGGSTGTNVKQ